MNNKVLERKQQLEFKADPSIKKYMKENSAIHSKIHISANQNNTAISYDSFFFLKLYRKVDMGQHPDLQLSRFLSAEVHFKNTPAYLGYAAWTIKKRELSIAQMQGMIENHGDGYSYMLDRINNYIERILSLENIRLYINKPLGTFTRPVEFDSLSEDLKILLGPRAAEQASLIGTRVAEMHNFLAAGNNKDFSPEHFSLHYQRSLFSSIQAPLEEAFYFLAKNKRRLPQVTYSAIAGLEARKTELIDKLKRVYSKKIDICKIRIHGNLNLRQVLFTGKDLAIHDFGGDPLRTLSERRLKRSPLRDVASMIRSFYYTAYEGFFSNTHLSKEETQKILSFALIWAHYMSCFFLKSYYENLGKNGLIPAEMDDLSVMMEAYIIEKAFVALNYELDKRPEYIIVPLKLIESI